MITEARFVCTFKGPLDTNPHTGDKGKDVVLMADADDPVFKVWTPFGTVSMRVAEPTGDSFEVGKKYRVLFEEI